MKGNYIMKNRNTIFTTILLALACFVLLTTAHAVVPAPDGAYGPPAYGTGNTAEGQNALLSLTTGSYNTGVGLLSLRSNTTTSLNTAIGAGALLANTADENTATGAAALFHNTTGTQNTANGAFALFSNTTGAANTANGFEALFNNFTGSGNTATGDFALRNNLTGSNNTALGDSAGSNVMTANNVIAIGSSGADVGFSCFIGNIRDVTTANNDAIPVLIDSTGQLGTASSSRRFKKEIKPMDKASEAILALKPVTFHYKSDKTNRPEFGLIAEEVAEVNPGLVVRDKNGDIYTVRYDAVNAMLLNEFLKEHKKLEEQQATIAQLKSAVTQQQNRFESKLAEQQNRIATLTAGLQNVSAWLETSKGKPRVVANNP
jgi:hypothetical protein